MYVKRLSLNTCFLFHTNSRVLGTRFGSLESGKITIGSLQIQTGFLTFSLKKTLRTDQKNYFSRLFHTGKWQKLFHTSTLRRNPAYEKLQPSTFTKTTFSFAANTPTNRTCERASRWLVVFAPVRRRAGACEKKRATIRTQTQKWNWWSWPQWCRRPRPRREEPSRPFSGATRAGRLAAAPSLSPGDPSASRVVTVSGVASPSRTRPARLRTIEQTGTSAWGNASVFPDTSGTCRPWSGNRTLGTLSRRGCSLLSAVVPLRVLWCRCGGDAATGPRSLQRFHGDGHSAWAERAPNAGAARGPWPRAADGPVRIWSGPRGPCSRPELRRVRRALHPSSYLVEPRASRVGRESNHGPRVSSEYRAAACCLKTRSRCDARPDGPARRPAEGRARRAACPGGGASRRDGDGSWWRHRCAAVSIAGKHLRAVRA